MTGGKPALWHLVVGRCASWWFRKEPIVSSVRIWTIGELPDGIAVSRKVLSCRWRRIEVMNGTGITQINILTADPSTNGYIIYRRYMRHR